MHAGKATEISGIFILIFSSILLLWGIYPHPLVAKVSGITAKDLGQVGSGAAKSNGLNGKDIGDNNPVDRASRETAGQIRIEVPEWIRAGDAAEIRLTFIPTPQALVTPSAPDLDVQSGIISSRNQYINLSAHLDLPGIPHRPSGEIRQLLQFIHPTIFLWNLRPDKAEEFHGNIWLRLVFFTNGGIAKNHQVLLNHQLEISVRRLFGLDGLQARLLGGLGVIIGIWFSFKGLILQRILGSDTRVQMGK